MITEKSTQFDAQQWRDNCNKYRTVLKKMFARMDFSSNQARDILLDSYLINLPHLLHFAYDNEIAPVWYLRQIEDILRDCATQQDVQKHLVAQKQMQRAK